MLYFSIYWEQSSHLTNVFQRGRYTTNQMGYDIIYLYNPQDHQDVDPCYIPLTSPSHHLLVVRFDAGVRLRTRRRRPGCRNCRRATSGRSVRIPSAKTWRYPKMHGVTSLTNHMGISINGISQKIIYIHLYPYIIMSTLD